MNTIYEPLDKGTIAKTRESFSARLLTDPQFEEFVPICAIINREIYRSASFIEKLETYAFAISRTERGINASKADTIIRDIFKSLFGQSMDQLRKSLLKAEEEVSDEQQALGLDFAYTVLQQIEDGEKMPFYRAFAHQAALYALELGITDIFAKKLISAQFEAAESREFYEEGKQFEDKFYRPQIEAEKRKRNSEKEKTGRNRYHGSVRGKNGSAKRSFENGSGDADLANNLGVGEASVSGKTSQPAPANG